jgi:hypothetical protein
MAYRNELTIVRIGAVVTVHTHGAVALVRRVHVLGGVARQLLVVGADAVPRRVRVAEHAGVQHQVGRRGNAGDHIRGGEGGLLDLGKVVVRVAVQRHDSDLLQRELGLRPGLGDVEDVVPELLGLLGRHDL